jgi:hypothetical protein
MLSFMLSIVASGRLSAISVRNIAGTEEGWAVLDAAVDQAKSSLGDGLVSAYAIGSLAHGGFRAWVSDVDVALLTGDLDRLDVVAVVETIKPSTKVRRCNRDADLASSATPIEGTARSIPQNPELSGTRGWRAYTKSGSTTTPGACAASI